MGYFGNLELNRLHAVSLKVEDDDANHHLYPL